MSTPLIPLLSVVTFFVLLVKSTSSDRNRRYLGGSLIKDDTVPFQSLVPIFRNEDTNEASCSGVVVGTRYVLTAAHCVMRIDPQTKLPMLEGQYVRQDIVDQMRIGYPNQKSYCASSSEFIRHSLPRVTQIRVMKPIFHDIESKLKPVPYDIAVLQVDRDIATSPQHITEIFSESKHPQLNTLNCVAGGYGLTLKSPLGRPPPFQLPDGGGRQITTVGRRRFVYARPGERCRGADAGDSCGSLLRRGALVCRPVPLRSINCRIHPEACLFCLCQNDFVIRMDPGEIAAIDTGRKNVLEFICQPMFKPNCEPHGDAVTVSEAAGGELLVEARRSSIAGSVVGAAKGDSGGPLYCQDPAGGDWRVYGIMRGRGPLDCDEFSQYEPCLPRNDDRNHVAVVFRSFAQYGKYTPQIYFRTGHLGQTISAMIDDMKRPGSNNFDVVPLVWSPRLSIEESRNDSPIKYDSELPEKKYSKGVSVPNEWKNWFQKMFGVKVGNPPNRT